MKFKKYPKIYALGKEETDGILNGECHIQEKIDGANTSIWLDNKEIKCGSRNNDLILKDNPFNGFVEYVKEHKGINKYLKDNPTHRLYGEWLVKHTVTYNEPAYKHFYLFDIFTNDDEFSPMDILNIKDIGDLYNIKTPRYFGTFKNPEEKDIKDFAGISGIGDKGEGIVIKNLSFINKFGSHQYGKIVTEKFKENNAITFRGNDKYSDTYWEMYIVNKYITLPRVKKIMQKIESSKGKLELSDTPKILSSVYHDILTEEIWDISKRVKEIKFKKLQHLVYQKSKQIFHDILNDSISIADNETPNT